MQTYIPPRKKRLAKWGTRLLIAVVVLGLIGGTGFMLFMKIKFSDFQPPMTAPDVIVAKVVPYKFSDKIEAIGTAVASQSATLTATVTETVKSINVDEGSFVKAGTIILELNNDEERATLDEAERAFSRYDKLARSKIGSEARRDQEKARMGVARAQLDKRRIVAPFDGVLGIRQVSVGDLVSPGTIITTIDSVDPIQVEFSVPESYLSVLKPGLSIDATSEAFTGEIFRGQISAIDSRINTMTRAIKIKADIPNPEGRLRPGLLMKADIVRAKRTSLAIPEQAIVATGERKNVLVVGADNKVRDTAITTGNRQAGYVEILGGLKDGEKVIIEGLQKARNGDEVKVTAEKTIDQTIGQAIEYSSERKLEAFPDKEVSPSADDQKTEQE